MNQFKSGWYLLYTKSKLEKKISASLDAQKLTYYLPTQTIFRQWADRNKIIRVPMFPSYIFIYLQNFADYFSGLNIDGVLHYVKFGNQIARVSEGVVDQLKLISEHGRNVEVLTYEFQEKESLTISSGPFAGMNCELVRHKNERRVLVRVELLRRSVLMEAPCDQLIKI